MSKNIDEIVEDVLPTKKSKSSLLTARQIERRLCQKELEQALTEKKLVVPLTKDEIWNILSEHLHKSSIYCEGKTDAANAVYQARFGERK